MLITDPLGMITFEVPNGWGCDSHNSTFEVIRLRPWSVQPEEFIDVVLAATHAPSARSDEHWLRSIQERLPDGPDLRLVPFPGKTIAGTRLSDASLVRRQVFLRGQRFDVVISAVGGEPGDQIVSNVIRRILESILVQPDEHLPEFIDLDTVTKLLDDEPAGEPDIADVALSARLESLSTQGYAAFVHARLRSDAALLSAGAAAMVSGTYKALITGSIVELYAADQLTSRILWTIESGSVKENAGDDSVGEQYRQALTNIHKRLVATPECDEQWQVLKSVLASEGSYVGADGFPCQPLPPLNAMSLFGAALYRTGTLAIDAGAWSVAVVSLSRAIDAGMALLIASRDHPAAFEVDGIDLVRHSLQMRNHALNQEIDTPIRADDQQFVVDLNRRTLELHPNDEDRARLGHSLAKLVFARGRLVDELDIAVDRQLVEEARQLLNATIEDDDARILLETADALVCVMEGVTDAAIAALQRARASTKPGPMIAEATAQLAVILIDAGRLAEASQLAAGLNGDDDSPVVQMALAAMALAENDRTAARSRLRSALLWSSVRSGPHGTVRALLRTAVSALDDEVAIAGHIEVTLLELDRLYLVTGLADDAERIVHGDSGEQRVAAEDLVERLLSQDLNDDAFALADDTRATVLRRRLLATEANERRPSAIRPPSTTITEFDHTRFFWEYSRYLRTEVRDALVASGYPTTPSFSDLRRVIRGCGRQVLLVQPIRDRVHLLLVDPDGEVSASVSPMARDDLWRHAKRVGQHFGIANVKLARGENPYLEALDDALRTSSESLAALHDALIEPVAPRLSNLPLILIPPGDMPIVPWNAIGTMDEPLINRSALSIAPSIATLGICRERRVERALPASAVVFADPQVAPEHHLSSLPGARSEGDDVASFLRGAGMADALVLQARGADATEAAFQSIVDAEFVHLACHAIVRDPVSMSGLYLTPGMADGVLTPPEIAEIDLSDAFVFLSACETGAGAPTLDGVLGIARAFLEAGARTVVMSAWKVEDNATRVLVQHFYRQFFGPDRPPVDVALANAIRALRAGLAAGRVRATTGTVLPDDPAIWAPFHALGDGSFSYG